MHENEPVIDQSEYRTVGDAIMVMLSDEEDE